jgi:hypothetical protein
MATRMQQRRGTAAQWTAANPTLAAGEIGFETDTNKFKMGNGSSAWTSLTYFANSAIVTDLIGGALPATLDTLTEIVTAINQDPAFFTTIATNLSTHAADTTLVHGITDTAALATQSYVTDAIDEVTGDYSALAGTGLAWNAGTEELEIDNTVATTTYADGVVGTHSSDTTSVHGIADTTALATITNVSTAQTAAETTASGYVSTHNSATTNVHGIADTSILVTTTGTQTLTNKTLTSPTLTTPSIGVASGTSFNSITGLSSTTPVMNGTAAVGTGTTAARADHVHDTDTSRAPLASPALTGTPTAPLATTGTNTTQIATTSFVQQELSVLTTGAPAALNTLDELAAALGDDANYAATITTSLGLKAPLASPTFTGTVTLPAAGIVFTDGTQAKEGVPSRTPIIVKTDSYTLSALTERDSLIEMGKATAQTVTIPLNATVAYPVGTSIDILQTGAGQVTIAPVSGSVTVNATPGLKLRTQWSSATLFKRAENTWVVFGDLTA